MRPGGAAGHDAQLPKPAGPVDQRATSQCDGGGSTDLANTGARKTGAGRFSAGFTDPMEAKQTPTEKVKPRQGRRSRVDPFEAHADLIPQWLEAEADDVTPFAAPVLMRAGG